MIDFDCDIYVDKCAKYTFTLHIVPSVHCTLYLVCIVQYAQKATFFYFLCIDNFCLNPVENSDASATAAYVLKIQYLQFPIQQSGDYFLVSGIAIEV